MKCTCKLLVLACLIIPLNESFGQTIEEIMETTWNGISMDRTEITESGYFRCIQTLKSVNYYEADNSFTAILKSKINLEGKSYECSWSVDGEVDPDDYSVVIRPDYQIISDILPGGLVWIADNIYLQLYIDAEHEDYFLMKGQSSSMEYSDEYYEFTSYPY